MTKASKLVEQNLNRCRAALRKNEVLAGLSALVAGVKVMMQHKIHSVDMQRIGNMLRENLATLNRLGEVNTIHPSPLTWSAGQEKELLMAVLPLLKTLRDEREKEDFEATRERRLKIDRALINGSNALEHGKIAEAQELFREAVSVHVDEDALFMLIAERLQGAGYYSESFEHLRKAFEVDPNSRRASELLFDAAVQTKDVKRGMKYFERVQRESGDTAQVLLGEARLYAAAKDEAKARECAEKALECDEHLVLAKRLLHQLAAKAE